MRNIVLIMLLLGIHSGVKADISSTDVNGAKGSANVSTAVTIYSSIPAWQNYQDLYKITDPTALPGYAIIRQNRTLNLNKGDNVITLNDVARYMDPSTFILKSLTDPNGTVLNAFNFNYDVPNASTLFQQYLGQTVTVEQSNGAKVETFSGKLLGQEDNGLLLQDNNGDFLNITNFSNIRFPNTSNSSSASSLITTPTLFLNIFANKSGAQQFLTSYQTQGMVWWVVYNALYRETTDAGGNTGLLDLMAWVNIINKTGIAYQNANIKLMAGELNQPTPNPGPIATMSVKMAGNAAASSGFTETPFFEYHMYTLGKATDLPKNSIKQLELFSKSNIPVNMLYIYSNVENGPYYYGQPYLNQIPGFQYSTKVDSYLSFINDKKHALGIPLPAGRVRISKMAETNGGQPKDASLAGEEYIGETVISHTPENETLQLKVGTAFDIVVDKKQVNFTVEQNKHVMVESYEITLKNSKNKDVTVIVREPLYRTNNWKIESSNINYNKTDSSTVEFLVPVKKGGENTLQYTVRYTW